MTKFCVAPVAGFITTGIIGWFCGVTPVTVAVNGVACGICVAGVPIGVGVCVCEAKTIWPDGVVMERILAESRTGGGVKF